ncbi:hypothetical protein SK128_025166 [Halocaridina rubra]|uniref:Neurotransmitter-gated ion-channel ligand-binding domain-containing protein n=1 Tax=Halocaridina rubra TaxID=373956 RepID=A0AAN8XJ69_HALRR
MVDRKTVAIKGGGRIVLGQNVHSEAKWDITQALHGEIADFRIYWNGDTWELEVRTVEEDAVAQMVEKKPKGYPIGLASWHTTADGCGEKTPQYLLTLCNEDSFTCSDGSCIKIDKRCDEQVDCLDNSDELSCEIIHVPLGYSVDLPPPSLDASSLNLMIDLDITSVRKFDLVGFMVHIDVIQRLTWRDARITYSNLKAGYFNNRAMATGEVWRPHVRIQDGTFSPTNVITRSEIFQVNREAPPLEDDDTRTGEDRLYDGAEHRIRIEEIYTVEFMCQFGLLMYPFDIQTCVFYMNITNIQDFILANGGANFTGERASLEYQLLDQQMLSLEGSRAVKICRVQGGTASSWADYLFSLQWCNFSAD